MKLSTSGMSQQGHEGGEKKCLNSELWHACAGPLVSLPTAGTRVVYFPQGHSEQVSATTNREIDGQIPNYPSLPPQLICQLHNVTMHADVETDEVYAQMTLQPLTPQEQKDTFLPMELGIPSKQPTNYFCKTLTASDTSTHGGFSVPRRAAEKVFPPLDFSQQPPAQELIARDLHDVEWKFRHIFRGQPKRHLLTTGWSVFVSAKRLVAGDSVLFIWNEKNQLLLGIRRASRPQTVMPSSVLSSDSMHIGLLAAAAHAAATNSCFTVFFNPRASPSEFVIPLSKYIKAVYHTRVSVGMRFRMLFETEESSVRRYMGTITSISDMDPVRWPNSHWRSVKVGWDESTAGERQPRVSLWEIEPLTTFPMYPSLFPLRLKRPWHPGTSSFLDGRDEATNGLMWMRGGPGDHGLNAMNFQGAGLLPWMQPRLDPTLLGNDHNQQYQAMLAAAGLQNQGNVDLLRQQMMNFQQPFNYQQSGNLSPMQLQQQQAIQQSVSTNNIMQPQGQGLAENLSQHILQKSHNNRENQTQQHSYQDSVLIQGDPLHQKQHSSLPSPSYTKPDFIDSGMKFTASVSPGQNMLGSLSSEGSGNLLNLSRSGHSMLTEQSPQQSWASKYSPSQVDAIGNSMSHVQYSGRDTSIVPPHCSSDAQNSVLFGVNIDSSGLLLPTTVPRYTTASAHADASTMPPQRLFRPHFSASKPKETLLRFPLFVTLHHFYFFIREKKKMEVVVAEALKPSLRTESIFQQTICEEILCLNANNVVVGEDFSVDDLLDFSNGEFQHGSVGKEVDVCEEEEEEEHEKNSTTSGSEHERTEDDDNSNSTTFSGAGDGESNSIFAGGLAVPADDVADLEWVSHFVDDSIPELSLLYPVQARSEPEPRPGPTNAYSQLSIIRRKPRTTKTRRPNCNVWIFNPILYSAKKQRKKPEAQTGGAHFQRRCSHCHVQKTPQWRAGPLGPKTLCNACGVRFKSGRLFPEYRPACSPTFSGEIHSNSHRKVLEMRRRKEVDEPVSGLNRIQMVTSW